MNSTIEKFGYPATLVKEFDHWLVLLRPTQVTLASLVLAAKSNETHYGALPPQAFLRQGDAVQAIEEALRKFTGYERINYLMLMMVDPHVHFHVFPRYSEARTWRGTEFIDSGWPGPPRLETGIKLDSEQLHLLATEVASHFR